MDIWDIGNIQLHLLDHLASRHGGCGVEKAVTVLLYKPSLCNSSFIEGWQVRRDELVPQWCHLVATFTVIAAWVAVTVAVIGGIRIEILVAVAAISIVFDGNNVVGICRSRCGITIAIVIDVVVVVVVVVVAGVATGVVVVAIVEGLCRLQNRIHCHVPRWSI